MKYPKVKIALARKSMTQGQLAKKLGMTDSYLSQKLNKNIKFDEEDMLRMAAALETSLDDLFMPEKFPYGNEVQTDKEAI